jgi:hypothetical protein
VAGQKCCSANTGINGCCGTGLNCCPPRADLPAGECCSGSCSSAGSRCCPQELGGSACPFDHTCCAHPFGGSYCCPPAAPVCGSNIDCRTS